MDKKNTPLDYSDNRIWVYIELGGKKFWTSDYIFEKIGFVTKKDIVEVEYGFNLFICNQQIPEVVKTLTELNQGIYQIVRINKE